jgi:hypothetical protein
MQHRASGNGDILRGEGNQDLFTAIDYKCAYCNQIAVHSTSSAPRTKHVDLRTFRTTRPGGGRVAVYTSERDAVAPVLKQNVFLLRSTIQCLPSTESWLRQKRQAMLAKSGSMACVR